ncbi:hypothetical protein FTX61_18890 [Nitriliruptoraceae bacterium ZYF776]|nr:hypothetical protein [Profundirhabdus halotolerans]
MTALVVVLTVVVALQLVLLVGLLRSHAEVLRRLHELGAGVDPDAAPRAADDPGFPVPDPTQASLQAQLGPLAAKEGRRASDVSGISPRGEVLGLRVADVGHDTLLVFLSTTCATCRSYWPALEEPEAPAGTRVVIVTREEPDEDMQAVTEVAPPGATVIMSSTAWEDHEVPGSPYVVHVDGSTGRVRGEGTAATWPAVRKLLLRSGTTGDASPRAKAAADARRERDADRHLLAAGITPGDPSLYQSADAPHTHEEQP